MLRSIKHIMGYTVNAKDGQIGKVEDILFLDTNFRVKHLVIDTHRWVPGKRVLVPTTLMGGMDGDEKSMDITLTRKELEACPEIESDRPVSMQHEVERRGVLQPMPYWYAAGVSPYMFLEPALAMEVEGLNLNEKMRGDPHLRSAHELFGYHVQANDGDVGHVDDLILDDEVWAIRYLNVDTRNWRPGGQVLVSTEWLKEVSWKESKVHVDLTHEAISAAPPFDHKTPMTREYEVLIHDYYGRQVYW